MLAAKCQALIQVNQEIAARCRSVPVLWRIHTAPRAERSAEQAPNLCLAWRWKPKLSRLDALLDAPQQLGPFQLRLRDVAAAAPLLEQMREPALLERLLALLEELQVALGRVEAKCLAAQALAGKGRLPTQLRHPYVAAIELEVRSAHAMGLAAYLLNCPEAEASRLHSHRDVACSWLALQLWGRQLIGSCVRIASTESCEDGVYMHHDGQRFVGFALQLHSGARRLYRFRFEQLESFHFGKLEVECEETAKRRLADLTEDPLVQEQTMFYRL